MSRWNLVIPDETDRSLRSYLARTGGKKGDSSKFVDKAVRRAISWETVDEIKDRNADFDQDEILNVIDDATRDARARRT